MHSRATAVLAAGLLLLVPAASLGDLAPYTQNFETLMMADPSALANDGWIVYGNVFTPEHVYVYGYGPFPAPNGGNAFSAIDAGQGGTEQGAQQLSVYNDYNNADHGIGRWIEANVFHEQPIGASDVLDTWRFQFDAKLGNLLPPSTAIAFIKTIDPAQQYAMTNFFPLDMTAIPATWGTYTIDITLDAALAGQLMQFGFASTATNYQSSGVYYDNVSWTRTVNVGVDQPGRPNALSLSPAAPNPFRQSTRLAYTLPAAGRVDLGVFDVGGRRVASLFHGLAGAGPHVALWDGRLPDGGLAPAGIYRAVLQTETGRTTRSLVLTR